MAMVSLLIVNFGSNLGNVESDYEPNIMNKVDVAERNIARYHAEMAEHQRVQDWGKKSLKDKLSSISLFRNRNTYSDASHNRSTVSLSEALKFTFGKRFAADDLIVKARKESSARDVLDAQFKKNVEKYIKKQEQDALTKKQELEKSKNREKFAENIVKEKALFAKDLRHDNRWMDISKELIRDGKEGISYDDYQKKVDQYVLVYNEAIKLLKDGYENQENPNLDEYAKKIITMRRVLRNQFYESFDLAIPHELREYGTQDNLIMQAQRNLAKSKSDQLVQGVYHDHTQSIDKYLTTLRFDSKFIETRGITIPDQSEIEQAYNKELKNLNELNLAEDVKNRELTRLKEAKNYFDIILPSYVARAVLKARIRS